MLFVTVLLMMPLVAAGGPIYNHDHDEGPISGSWTDAEVTGWWDPPDKIIYSICHDSDFDFAQGYYGTPSYEQYPEEEGEDALYGWTIQEIYVFQGGQFVEHVESEATIPYN